MSVFITSSGSGSTSIPELTSDPVSPTPQSAWVLATTSIVGGGDPIGLLMALTHAGAITYSYQLSYRTLENTTVRVALT